MAARRRTRTLTFALRPDAALAPRAPASRSVEPDAGPLARTITISLEDAKAEDIVSIDLRGKTTLADLMVIATGRSNVHVAAIADRLLKALKSDGRPSPRIEGLPQGDWVLLDASDAIVHIFRPEVRKFYNLEKLWGADRPGEKRQSRAI
ncbi:MAG TPA: ribosome silencing factor [Roseiarcus sp.]|nr:ribosome silencing factor [Roseiarcus sp.]